MRTRKRIWTKLELTLAYYMARYEMSGVDIKEDALIHTVIGNTTRASFRMQVANFRYLLNIEGYQLQHVSQAMKDLCGEYDTKSQSEIKMLVIDYIGACDAKIMQQSNQEAYKKRDKLNSILKTNFENKLAALKKYRRLVPKIK